jgi:hypothetical protein
MYALEQKVRKIYNSFDVSCKELKDVLHSDDDTNLMSIDELLDEL